jgi:ERCC4 domain
MADSELLIAANPYAGSTLPFLLLVPLASGLLLRAGETWPRKRSLYCQPLPLTRWPQAPELVDRVGVLSCVRRGMIVDLVLDRGRENRSQLVYTTVRGREAVFWQSPRTTTKYKPRTIATSDCAAEPGGMAILIDTREQDGYSFADLQVASRRQALPCGDYGIAYGGRLIASVERKSLTDLVSSLHSGRLEYALGELAALPRAALVVEDRLARLPELSYCSGDAVAERLAWLQVHYPNVPIVFAETRTLAEQWIYRYLRTAYQWTLNEKTGLDRIGVGTSQVSSAPVLSWPATEQARTWARQVGLDTPIRGPVRPEIFVAWQRTHPRA